MIMGNYPDEYTRLMALGFSPEDIRAMIGNPGKANALGPITPPQFAPPRSMSGPGDLLRTASPQTMAMAQVLEGGSPAFDQGGTLAFTGAEGGFPNIAAGNPAAVVLAGGKTDQLGAGPQTVNTALKSDPLSGAPPSATETRTASPAVPSHPTIAGDAFDATGRKQSAAHPTATGIANHGDVNDLTQAAYDKAMGTSEANAAVPPVAPNAETTELVAAENAGQGAVKDGDQFTGTEIEISKNVIPPSTDAAVGALTGQMVGEAIEGLGTAVAGMAVPIQTQPYISTQEPVQSTEQTQAVAAGDVVIEPAGYTGTRTSPDGIGMSRGATLNNAKALALANSYAQQAQNMRQVMAGQRAPVSWGQVAGAGLYDALGAYERFDADRKLRAGQAELQAMYEDGHLDDNELARLEVLDPKRAAAERQRRHAIEYQRQQQINAIELQKMRNDAKIAAAQQKAQADAAEAAANQPPPLDDQYFIDRGITDPDDIVQARQWVQAMRDRPTKYQMEFEKQRDRVVSAEQSGTMSKINKNRALITQAKGMKGLLTDEGDLPTGQLAPVQMRVGQFLESLGVKRDSDEWELFGLGKNQTINQELFQQFANRLLLGELGPGGFPTQMLSDKDVEFLKQTNPGIMMTPGAIETMIDVMIWRQEQGEKYAQAYTKFSDLYSRATGLNSPDSNAIRKFNENYRAALNASENPSAELQAIYERHAKRNQTKVVPGSTPETAITIGD